MAMNLFRRYIWLADTVSDYGPITLAEIQRRWRYSSLNDEGTELSARTFLNHRRQIEAMFEIDIECDKGSNTYRIDTDDGERYKELKRRMLDHFSLGITLSEASAISNRIVVEQVHSGERHLALIINAMRDNRVLDMTYLSYRTGEEQDVTIEPYALKMAQHRWYLVGRNREKKSLRTYALDGISDPTPTGDTFTMPKDFDVNDYFEDCFGVDRSEEPERIRIKVKASQVPYFRSLPLHHSQKEVKGTENCDYTVFEYYLRPTYDFYQALFSHNTNIEVLEPQRIRKSLKDWIGAWNEIY